MLKIGSKAEYNEAKIILMHTPTNAELFMGILHPEAALFQCVFNPYAASIEHKNFIEKLRQEDISVINVKDVLLYNTIAEDGSILDTQELADLREFSKNYLSYSYDNGIAFYEENLYKESVLQKLHPRLLVDIILTQPHITTYKTDSNTGTAASYNLKPLANLYFLRDQSITTCKGVVMSKMNSQQREHEVSLIKFVYNKLGIIPIHEVDGSGYLEGGDFIPAGAVDFIGQGLRTNEDAIKQLFTHDVFCADKVVVVKDSWKNQDQMHLDTYFNIISSDIVALVENRLSAAHRHIMRLKADVYERNQEGYSLIRQEVDFVNFLANDLNFNIIPVPVDDQLKYGVNFLTIRENVILGIDGVSEEYKTALSDAGVDATWLDFTNLTCGYGAAHCTTQVLYREATDNTSFSQDL